MISSESLQQFVKQELIDILNFNDLCLNVNNEIDFIKLFKELRVLVPYKFAVCCFNQYAPDGVTNCVSDILNISYPQEWINIYLQKNYFSIDPIIQTHFETFKIQKWSDTYRKYDGIIDPVFLSSSTDFGLKDGLTYGIGDNRTAASLFSFALSSHKITDRETYMLLTTVPHVHQALLRVIKNKKKQEMMDEDKIALPLTRREKEILNWIGHGKTNWEISVILSISERTAKFHVSNIINKLNASTRSHAVAKALELDIISL